MGTSGLSSGPWLAGPLLHSAQESSRFKPSAHSPVACLLATIIVSRAPVPLLMWFPVHSASGSLSWPMCTSFPLGRQKPKSTSY